MQFTYSVEKTKSRIRDLLLKQFHVSKSSGSSTIPTRLNFDVFCEVYELRASRTFPDRHIRSLHQEFLVLKNSRSTYLLTTTISTIY